MDRLLESYTNLKILTLVSRTLRNHDGDGNVKKAVGFQTSKTTTLHAFLWIL